MAIVTAVDELVSGSGHSALVACPWYRVRHYTWPDAMIEGEKGLGRNAVVFSLSLTVLFSQFPLSEFVPCSDTVTLSFLSLCQSLTSPTLLGPVSIQLL